MMAKVQADLIFCEVRLAKTYQILINLESKGFHLENYSDSSTARPLMAHLPWLIRTKSRDQRSNLFTLAIRN